jgi:hypothetical protein
MGGRMTTLKESQKSVAVYQSEQAAKRDAKRQKVMSQFAVADRVMSVDGRRLGTVRGVLGGESYVVRFLDTEKNEQVDGAGLLRRFTAQSTSYAAEKPQREEVSVEEQVA